LVIGYQAIFSWQISACAAVVWAGRGVRVLR
jgi:hypothetical protein